MFSWIFMYMPIMYMQIKCFFLSNVYTSFFFLSCHFGFGPNAYASWLIDCLITLASPSYNTASPLQACLSPAHSPRQAASGLQSTSATVDRPLVLSEPVSSLQNWTWGSTDQNPSPDPDPA